jgi:Tfp pilus assembly protein PilF
MNINMGVLLQKQGKHQKAETYLAKACKLGDENHEDHFAALFNLGLNHIHTGKLTESVSQFNRSLDHLN